MRVPFPFLITDYYEKLSGKRVAPEVLVEKSFAFLLERESNTSILRSFELLVISRYFPAYEKTIATLLEGPRSHPTLS
jgi:hypothetical protein